MTPDCGTEQQIQGNVLSIPHDPLIRAIENLRDPDSLVPALRRVWEGMPPMQSGEISVRLLYLNYKPFERARLVLSLTATPSDPDLRPVVKELALEVKAGRRSEPWLSASGTGGDSTGFVIPEWRARGWGLPDTPHLRELKILRDPKALRDRIGPVFGFDIAATTVRLLRYVPGKRAVLLITPPGREEQVYAKLMRSRDAVAVAACFHAIDRCAQTGSLAFSVPRVLRYEPKLATVFMSEVAGRTFTGEMWHPKTRPYVAIGRALASLHRAEIRPVEFWTIARQLDDLRRHLRGMGQAIPAIRERLDAQVARLCALGTEFQDDEGVPIHGNLFGDQILWDGQQIGIVDWDRLAIGDPLYDLGRLLAHQIYESRLNDVSPESTRVGTEALIVAYGGAIGPAPDRYRLAWHVAVELLLRAKISSLRPLAPNWQDHCARIVDECDRVLHGQCAFVSLPALSPERKS